jgi:hypothetical protein
VVFAGKLDFFIQNSFRLCVLINCSEFQFPVQKV